MKSSNPKSNIPDLIKGLQRRLRQLHPQWTQQKIGETLYGSAGNPKANYIQRFIRRTATTTYTEDEVVSLIEIFSSVMTPSEAVHLIAWTQVEGGTFDRIRELDIYDQHAFDSALMALRKKQAAYFDPSQTLEDNQPPKLQTPVYGQPDPIDLGAIVDITAFRDRILGQLTNDEGGRFISIEGQGGIGKTTVAYTVVARLRHTQRFKAILWLSVGSSFTAHRAKTQNVNGSSLLGQIGQVLKAQDTPTTLNILQNEPYLVVVDNIENDLDAANILPSLSQLDQASSKFLLTSRRALDSTYPFVASFELPPLSPDSSRDLLIRLFARHNTSLRPQEIQDIVATASGIPLALHLIAKLARVEPIDKIIRDIHSYQAGKQNKPGDKPSSHIDAMFEHIYSKIWLKLTDEVRDLLVCLALSININGIDRDWIPVTCGVQDHDLPRLLMEAVDYYLITIKGTQRKRITMHPLTMYYIRSRSHFA